MNIRDIYPYSHRVLQGYTKGACSNVNPSINIDTYVYLIYLPNFGLN
jgi:hypothetical protein